MKRALFWTPRVLCILFAAFISLFALDVFSEGYDVWETIVALFMHMIPTMVILLALAVAWRWEWTGALLFCALAVVYTVTSRGAALIISGPLFVIGVLFLVNWVYRAEMRSRG
jgi:hypothetical protein